MAPEEHSVFSPSSMAQKLKCPGSHKAALGIKSSQSDEALWGTQCHIWAETLFWKPNIPSLLFSKDWQEQCTRDMVQMAWDIAGEFEKYPLVHNETRISLEWLTDETVDMSQVWGTADVIMYDDQTRKLVILDYKTGIGVPVFPENNVQLMIYGLGALGFVGYPNVDTVELVIAQPRIDPMPRRWTISSADLLTWGEDVLKPGIKAMLSDDAAFVVGDHCRWCPIRGRCTAQRDQYLELMDSAPEPAKAHANGVLSIAEINDLMRRIKEIRTWTNEVEAVAMDLMKSGTDLPDFKLVEGRSTRKWKDEEEAEKFLAGQKLKLKERYTMKLLSPPQAEKKLKAKFSAVPRTRKRFESLVEKPKGKPTWAPKTDKRPAIDLNPTNKLVTLNDLI